MTMTWRPESGDGWQAASRSGYDATTHIVTHPNPMTEKQEFRTWMCLICGFIYTEAEGLPDEGIAPGTRWEDIPINWTCPECGARKEDFEMVEL
jgi:rubredoxin